MVSRYAARSRTCLACSGVPHSVILSILSQATCCTIYIMILSKRSLAGTRDLTFPGFNAVFETYDGVFWLAAKCWLVPCTAYLHVPTACLTFMMRLMITVQKQHVCPI